MSEWQKITNFKTSASVCVCGGGVAVEEWLLGNDPLNCKRA